MIERRPFATLGRFENEWLSAHYHFSFADYHDPARVDWGALRVWNDDRIRAGTGFPPHGHRDMEIVTYIRQGAITHQDGLGNEGRTVAGDVQVMSAGRGITHAEFNREDEDTLLFQIWIQTARRGADPRWETRQFPTDARAGRLIPLASGRPGDDGALSINQDAAVLGATLAAGCEFTHPLAPGRRAYLVPARGRVTVNGVTLETRDGAAIQGEDKLVLRALEEAELVMVEVG
ncbi:MAG: pirin family protein [Alphaproteobacteria bacterium]|nr:pirin family protein [Alphaproteobacteria bacterium]